MKKQFFISKTPKVASRRTGDLSVHHIVYIKGVHSSSEVVSYDEKGMPVTNENLHITFSVKTIEASSLANIKESDVLNNQMGVTTESENETYEIDLEAVDLPTMNISSFENSKQMQDWLNGYYLQAALNEGKDYGVENWIEKQF